MLKIIGGLFVLTFIIVAIVTLWTNYDQDWWR